MPRTLVVMRHAKAEAFGPTDFDRPLAQRGHADAGAVGAFLAGAGITPQHALVSAALRTRETWESAAAAAGWDISPDLDPALYHAGTDAALDLIGRTADDVECVVVVGHNPTMASLAYLLDDGDGPATADLGASSFPTSATAVFSYDGAWADLAPQSATLTHFHVGRG